MVVVTSLAVATRLYDIKSPAWVAWDETHFGKMASWYINGTYFFDVHPPLGKLLIALSGKLTGYNGSFAFVEPGYLYNETNYLGMRSMCALMGASVVPMGFTIVHDLSGSLPAAVFSALLMIFDVGLITLGRFILLDPILLFFMMAATMFNFRFNNFREFSLLWWCHLFMTGVMLGCVISVKFVGIFVVLLIGTYTVSDLWWIYCDTQRPLLDFLRHFLARTTCLIATPLTVYLMVFAVHDYIIYKVQDGWGLQGDGWLSSGYQMALQGNDMFNLSQPKYLAYGSLVTLHSAGSYRTYLHSHNLTYPDSQLPNVSSGLPFPLSHVHSVTGFRLKDANNYWRIEPFDEVEVPDWRNPRAAVEPVLNGDTIRLVHNITSRTLAVFNRAALQVSTQKLLGAMNESQVKPYQTAFIIEADGLEDEAWLEPINTTFRLFNPAFKCGVYSTGEKLPKWSANQIEMICSRRMMDDGATWAVQRHINKRLPNITTHWRKFLPSFFGRFVEAHQIISTTNAKMKPSHHEMRDSDQPWMWPILFRGLHFSAVDEHRVYLLGTPTIWWLCLLCLNLSGLAMGYVAFHDARYSSYMLANVNHLLKRADSSVEPTSPSSIKRSPGASERWRTRRRLGCACFWLWLGWMVHYVPFWFMGRILYFHHYFPALCFSCMLSGVLIDFTLHFCRWMGPNTYKLVAYSFIAVIILSFYMFSPLAYGMHGSRPKLAGVNSTYYNIWWSRTWDL